ncbi:MAG: SGNH/GDSL hydrolase family protein [Trebonia sp.]|jgi:lysophospholipase L1-like esterase
MTCWKTRTPLSCPTDEKEDGVPGHDTPHEKPPPTSSHHGQPGGRRRGWSSGRRAACTALSAAGIALLLAACSTASDPTASATGTAAPARTSAAARTSPAAGLIRGSYVALGDSYTSGPDIPDQTGATAGCDQSSSSYPYLVARSLRLKLTDVSCSSATIASLAAAQSTGDGTNPAQLSALSPATALVTLGIGGNDVGWVQIITRCTEMDLIPALIPGRTASGLTPCQDYYTAGGTNVIEQRTQSVARQLGEALTRIRQRAPRARVYVVGYPDLFPAGGDACADALGLTKGDVAFLNDEELRFNGMLRQAAQAAKAGYINTYTPSEGHNACSAPASRWIEPLIPDAPAAPLHPNAAGEQGMADAVVGTIRGAA